MLKRLVWLSLCLLVPVVFLLFGIDGVRGGSISAPFDLIINEWSQGNGGSKEWVELLVITDSADLRGWDLGDSSAGDLTFSNDSFWSDVPAGSLIVIYNGNDPDTILPSDDVDLSDCTAVLPHNNGTYFSGSWPAFANSTGSDNPHLRDDLDATVHDFSTDPGIGLHASAQENAQFEGDTAISVTNPAKWSNQSASIATPASGNTLTNSNWIASLCNPSTNNVADLVVTKSGAATAVTSSTITYTLSLQNNGNHTATAVILTDTLPVELTYLDDDSGLPFSQPQPEILVWQVGDLPPNEAISFDLVTSIDPNAIGLITNSVKVTTTFTETNLGNNEDMAVTAVSSGQASQVLITAVMYDGYETNDDDEAIALTNLSDVPVDISDWQIQDGGSGQTAFPANIQLVAGQRIWLTKNNLAFRRQFGFDADFEAQDSDPDIPNLSSSWPGFANSGDTVLLLDNESTVVDGLIYGDESVGAVTWWLGMSIQPYQVSSLFASEGQILYRKLNQQTGLPVEDTNTVVDWAQETEDVINGRKVQYPGWDLEQFFFPNKFTETAVITLAVAPDNAYQAIVNQIDAAQTSIQIETHTFENIAIANALIAASQRDVVVTILLEGGPPGGLPNQEKYICQQIEAANGQCWFMISNNDENIFDRYRFIHAKFLLIDGQTAVISSENLSPNSLPSDNKDDGTWGRRGVVLITDAPTVIAHIQTLFTTDFDPDNHVDIFRWTDSDTTYGAPPAHFIPVTQTGGISYTVRYPNPVVFSGNFPFELIQSPENSLRDEDALLGLLNHAGVGDTILVQQLGERPYWGSSNSNPTDDPNPRLEAYINAARRGATVRILLDAYFNSENDPLSNSATCQYVKQIAQTEHLRLDCAVANPTGLGIHNKMVLAHINGEGIIHIGSINGTELSHKGNRELAIQLQSNDAYDYLAAMFTADWPHRVYMPLGFSNFMGNASHILISEVMYDPAGLDDAEFIELANPTNRAIDLSNYALGDAVNPTDFEDTRRFPVGTILNGNKTLVVATSATAFFAEYGTNPTFEILESDPTVPNLIDDPNWGDPATFLQLGNAGDEVILRDGNDVIIDALGYGESELTSMLVCPLVTTLQTSLERFPHWRDTDDCTVDFREQAFPNPNSLPE